jgi:hypothetical protein
LAAADMAVAIDGKPLRIVFVYTRDVTNDDQ